MCAQRCPGNDGAPGAPHQHGGCTTCMGYSLPSTSPVAGSGGERDQAPEGHGHTGAFV